MTDYKIALNFEDGVTRFIACKDSEKVLDAAYRNKINLPMDCSDGVCGTCKCRAESGTYDLGDDFIDDALTADEAKSGLVLTCQMKPTSDCVIAVPTTSASCKTGQQRFLQRWQTWHRTMMLPLCWSWMWTRPPLFFPANMSILLCRAQIRADPTPSAQSPAKTASAS